MVIFTFLRPGVYFYELNLRDIAHGPDTSIAAKDRSLYYVKTQLLLKKLSHL